MKPERAQELRMAIDRLPLSTRRAMVRGMEKNRIIVGADASLSGLCPILAASGSAQQVGRPFARAWDRYARARLPRAATERELLTLRSMLDTSIARDQTQLPALNGAIVSHQVAQRRTEATLRRRAAQGKRDAAARREAAQDAREAAREVRHALRDLRLTAQGHAAPPPDAEVRYSADYLRPAARVAAVKAEAKAKGQAEARARALAEAEAKATASRRRPVEPERPWELASRDGWSWLRPARRFNDYEQALLDLERELVAVERGTRPDDRELVATRSARD